jgi:hypothetical protein
VDYYDNNMDYINGSYLKISERRFYASQLAMRKGPVRNEERMYDAQGERLKRRRRFESSPVIAAVIARMAGACCPFELTYTNDSR